MCLNECQSPLKSDFKISRYVDPNWKLKETDGKTRPKEQFNRNISYKILPIQASVVQN